MEASFFLTQLQKLDSQPVPTAFEGKVNLEVSAMPPQRQTGMDVMHKKNPNQTNKNTLFFFFPIHKSFFLSIDLRLAGDGSIFRSCPFSLQPRGAKQRTQTLDGAAVGSSLAAPTTDGRSMPRETASRLATCAT